MAKDEVRVYGMQILAKVDGFMHRLTGCPGGEDQNRAKLLFFSPRPLPAKILLSMMQSALYHQNKLKYF